jgi:hypothetical protein
MFSNKNTKACAVYLFYIDTNSLLPKWLGAVAWRNPNDFNFEEFVPESPIDQTKTGTFAFGSFGGRREKDQTIFDCAFEETKQECGNLVLPELKSRLGSAPFICRDLKGNYTKEYSPDIEYACITFFVMLGNYISDLSEWCTDAAIKSYERQLNDGEYPMFDNIEKLQKYKRNIESIRFKSIDINDIITKLQKNILPVVDVSDKKQINPSGFPEASLREGNGLNLSHVPLMPRVAKTLCYIPDIFTVHEWCEALYSKLNSYQETLDKFSKLYKPYQYIYNDISADLDKLWSQLNDLFITDKTLIDKILSPLINACNQKDLDEIMDKFSDVLLELERSKYQKTLQTFKEKFLMLEISDSKDFMKSIESIQNIDISTDNIIKNIYSFNDKHFKDFIIFDSLSYLDDFNSIYYKFKECGYDPQ